MVASATLRSLMFHLRFSRPYTMVACFLDIIDGICEQCSRTVTFSRRPMEIASLFMSRGIRFGVEQPS